MIVRNFRRQVTRCFDLSDVQFTTACPDNRQFFGVGVRVCAGGLYELQEAGSVGSPVVTHVFAADPQLHLHAFHYQYAQKFGVLCRSVCMNPFLSMLLYFVIKSLHEEE